MSEDDRINDELSKQIKQQQEYLAMMEQVETLQKKLNATKDGEEMNEESLNRIFSEEKRINTGFFNSNVQ